nr:hypothetical protein [uncultured Mucilaginibacter sp.]
MKQRVYSFLFFALLLLSSLVGRAQNVDEVLKQKPFTINGTFGAGIGTYTTSSTDPRERSFSYLFNGAPTMTIYGISFPLSVVISDQQRGFRQPFNQYGISPQYKWLTVHAGWQSITWSPFTLAGYNFLGGGVEATPGKWRLGFIYGRFNKAIEENSTQPLSFQTPAYKRMGYSTRIGYGTERNHFDFTLLDAKDDINSLPGKPLTPELSPAQNLVLGINQKWSLYKHFVWDIDMAASIYTRNQKDDTLKNLQLDKVPLIKDLITINASTQLLTALQTQLDYRNKNYSIGLQYRRVDPDYKSMGAYYFETDVANYTVQGTLALMKSQVQLSGSLGFQNDNLLNDKAYTSHRNISSLGASYNTSKYGIDLRYANYGITQDRGLNPVIDTFRVARTNYNFNTMLRYSMGDSLITHNFVLVGNLQSLVDLNRFTANRNKTNSKTGNLSYQIGFNKQALSFNANMNYTVADFSNIHSIIYGPSLGVSKQLQNGRVGLNASVAYQLQHNNGVNAGSIVNGNLNGSYRVTKRDGVNLSLSYLKSNSKDITLPSFNEVRSSLNLTHTF